MDLALTTYAADAEYGGDQPGGLGGGMNDDEGHELRLLATVAANCFVFAALSAWIAISHLGDWLGHFAGIGSGLLTIEGIIWIRRYLIRSRELRK